MSDQYYEKYKNIKLKYINLKNKYIMNGGSDYVPSGESFSGESFSGESPSGESPSGKNSSDESPSGVSLGGVSPSPSRIKTKFSGTKLSLQPKRLTADAIVPKDNICPIVSPIIPNLYLGNQYNATDECMAPYNIKAIVNITTEASKNSKLVNLQIPLEDTPNSNIMQYFDITYDFIDIFISTNQSIYVHCKEGISRSATIVIAYLMRKQKITLEEALTFVKEKRPVINPNMGFIFSLKQYENTLNLHR